MSITSIFFWEENVISGTPCTDIILSIVYGTAIAATKSKVCRKSSNEDFNGKDIEVDDKLVTRGRGIVIIIVIAVVPPSTWTKSEEYF